MRAIHLLGGLTGVLLGVGSGLLVADGRIWPLITIPLLALALWVLVRLVPPNERYRVGLVVALAFAMHVAIGVVLYTWALAAGRGGFIPGDDAEYAFLARTFVAYAQGVPDPASLPPSWGGAAYLFGTWVYLEILIFFLIGAEVLVPILLNGAFAIAMSLLVYDMGRRLFDRRAAFIALVLTAFFPSLVLWSSLNLKDALALLLIALCLWSLVRFQQRPRWQPLVLAYTVLLAMESLRDYIFVGLALLIPLVVAVTPGLRMGLLVRWTGAAALVSMVFLSAFQTGVGLGPQILDTFQSGRSSMAVGARTAYVEPPPIVVNVGDTFVVPGGAPSRDQSAEARVVHVAPNARIVLCDQGSAETPPAGVVCVVKGDIVVVGDRTPAPILQRRSLPVGAASTRLASADPEDDGTAALGTLRHLPVGLAFSLFGPFPWLFERGLDYLILPENAIWYVCLAAAAVTAVRERRRWRRLAPLVLFAGGLILLLSLVEGNWGTLFRHRAMVIPWVALMGAPTIALLIARLRRDRGRQ